LHYAPATLLRFSVTVTNQILVQTSGTMSSDQATKFPQTNASLQVQTLETVESFLSRTTSADTSTYDQLERMFRAIETAVQAQESYIAN
jgi:hypothetical protein